MDNYYFTQWISRHGKENFITLINSIVNKVSAPKELLKVVSKDEVAFHYFWVVYCIATLNYFGLNEKQIEFFVELGFSPEVNKYFKPKDILERHKTEIKEINKYIELDLKKY